jgi:Ca2+-binding RTX toxin-like protein
MRGDDQNDTIKGQAGSDTLRGGNGANDNLIGGDGDDVLDGELGDSDRCEPDGGTNLVILGTPGNNFDGCEMVV